MDKKSVIKVIRKCDYLFWPRFALNLINVVLHISNLVVMHQAAESITAPDPQVAKFLAMRFRYFTTWVVMLHIVYSITSLALEVYHKVTESREKDPVEKYEIMLNYPSEVLFKGIIWPSTIVVTGFFWSVFIYDRELIFPKFVDEVVSCVSNHILHTWIAIFIVLEVLVHPRLHPRPSTLGYARAGMVKFQFLAAYVFVFYYTRITEGIWLYPIFSVAYNGGVIQFFLLHTVLLLLYLYTTRLFWTYNNRIHKKILKF